MNDEWRQRLLSLMHERGVTPAELTRRAGVNATMVHDITKRGMTPSIANLEKLAGALGVRLVDILDPTLNMTPQLRLTGVLAGGEMWGDSSSSEREVAITLLGSDLISISVQTNDLAPTYKRGDIICGPKSVGTHVDNHLGCDCIIKLTTGERLVRTLHRGTKPGTYTLRSLDRNLPDIQDASCEWVAPIQMILRGQG